MQSLVKCLKYFLWYYSKLKTYLLIKESSWQLAEESNTITQWMNHAATFTSWFYTGTTSGAMASLFSNNMKQGLPMHFHGKYMKKVALQSKTHLIQKTCRKGNLLRGIVNWSGAA